MNAVLTAEAALDAVVAAMKANLPEGITPRDVDGFVRRHRDGMLEVLRDALGSRRTRGDVSSPATDDTDLWTPRQRTAANLAAMTLAADKAPDEMTAHDLALLSRYSGWGGLSIRGAADLFPANFPAPEERGLIHEYYTPTKVAREVARVIAPLVPSLPTVDDEVLALEPSAGIGRFVQAAKGIPGLNWHVVEWSDLSSRMLQAMRPDLDVYQGPFERWVREHGHEVAGRLGLVVSNPPYGARGVSITEDPNRGYREKNAYAYFLRRGLDLLAPEGLGVYLIPGGFLTGRSTALRSLREKVLKRHHLATAYRLPSGIFPGAMLVVDVLFFRARTGELAEVDEADQRILDGGYFEEFPDHILGTEVGKDAGDDDQTAKPRWGYQVVGEFERLPDLVERPVCGGCALAVRRPPGAGRAAPSAARAVTLDTSDLSERAASAVALGQRVDRYLAAVAAETSDEHVQLWPELVEALNAWANTHGNPWAAGDVQDLARRHSTGAERFLQAFTRTGRLVDAVAQRPTWTPRYGGQRHDVVALAEWAYRTKRSLSIQALADAVVEQFGDAPEHASAAVLAALPTLVSAGWCFDGDEMDQLVPERDYYTGHLWAKVRRCDFHHAVTDEKGRLWGTVAPGQINKQRQHLMATIQPAVLDDIDGVSPRQGWVPLELVAAWMTETLNGHYGKVELERRDGLVQAVGVAYEDLDDEGTLSAETRWCIGWLNHDKPTFKPKKEKKEDSLDDTRLKKAEEWEASFRAWVGSVYQRKARVERAYNQHFKGFIAPTYDAEPLPLARWTKDGVRLHPHQTAGARRVLANRGGLVAFDVGVGKTYTGIAVLAQARQDGWCRRPVILVPNSIVWKWEADIRRVLPDYRVAVIGSTKKVIARGPRKGLVTSDTDTPAERAAKWTAFQAGMFDVVLLTYTALARTRMNEEAVRAYSEDTDAIQREVTLRKRNAADAKKPTERQQAILKEGMAAWIAEQMELPEGWEYDPGVAWDDIGIDLLMVDEAQNFKNLYLPEAREGGVPRFMGNAGEGSKRAWQLDFRCAAVRRRTGGSGIVLLSATPAKNSPLEFYSLIQYVDHDAWSRMGIFDPEQFIDRYLQIEMREVIDTKMDLANRPAVVGFQNLHELREVVFRYGEFKTAEDVGLKLPDPTVNMVEVDMNAAQNEKYDRYVSQIEEALDSTRTQDKGKILGLLARLALVAIHPDLDEGYDWKTAATAPVEPVSPKFEAMAKRVLRNRTCGHIVFVDNVAAHRWVVATLVKAGIPEGRIAVLNASTAKAAADRQRIALEFNGDPEEGIAPKYDVVIANAIAYEGIDLQTRTCAIHHLDLPWEPATLQQRNGRGVRQGNTLAHIEINYYFARRSQDGLRFNLIQGKLGWMTALLKSQARDTNNPGAQMDLGAEDILLLISRNPEKTAERLAQVRAAREVEAKKKVAADAARMLRGAVTRFRKAERVDDPTEAARLRLEAEERLADVARVDPEAWPWARWAYAARDHELLVPDDGSAPVFEGLRAAVPDIYDPERLNFIEFGRVSGTSIGLRAAGTAVWTERELAKLSELRIRPEHLDPSWPADDDATTSRAVTARVENMLRFGGRWPSLDWSWASDAWLARTWATHESDVLRRMAAAQSWYTEQQHVPGVHGGHLVVARGTRITQVAVLPPTLDGWREFLDLAPASGLRFSELEAVGVYWWSRKIPRDLLSAAREDLEDAA